MKNPTQINAYNSVINIHNGDPTSTPTPALKVRKVEEKTYQWVSPTTGRTRKVSSVNSTEIELPAAVRTPFDSAEMYSTTGAGFGAAMACAC